MIIDVFIVILLKFYLNRTINKRPSKPNLSNHLSLFGNLAGSLIEA